LWRFGRKESLNGSGFFFWQRTIPPLDPANPACPAGWPRVRKVKGGNWRIFMYFSEHTAWAGVHCTSSGQGKGVLNKRERNVLDIHYGLMKAPPLKQISGWAFGFGSVGLSVCLSVWYCYLFLFAGCFVCKLK
jgi:hypothetical protein